ncbi:MAG: ABC transporter ATP-binding protein [Lentimicrobiaceae bacterium]|nr:ABC transporter ATP-binding protein [Lentimicrobiaceae bacterium]
MDKLVELVNITAGYGKQVVLTDISLTIHDRDFIGVIGPNGGGKTTLLKVIIGLLSPFAGTVRYFTEGAERYNLIGYLPQLMQHDPKFPIGALDVVLSGIIAGNRLSKKVSGDEKKLAMRLMEQMGVAHLHKKAIGELSGGERQRLFLCRSIISNPRLLILDEPDTFVDNRFEHDLYGILQELNERMAVIMVSHDIGTISANVKTIACVNRNLHYHPSNIITEQQLAAYDCPIQLITHGNVPHTVLKKHDPWN